MSEFHKDNRLCKDLRMACSTPKSNAVTMVFRGNKELRKTKRLGEEGEPCWGEDNIPIPYHTTTMRLDYVLIQYKHHPIVPN